MAEFHSSINNLGQYHIYQHSSTAGFSYENGPDSDSKTSSFFLNSFLVFSFKKSPKDTIHKAAYFNIFHGIIYRTAYYTLYMAHVHVLQVTFFKQLNVKLKTFQFHSQSAAYLAMITLSTLIMQYGSLLPLLEQKNAFV